MSLIVDEHREYLSDRARLDAFARAISEVVRPGDVVLDLGAGTGILGLLACRAGAARVYAVEQTSLIGLTRELARANGFDDRIVHVKGHSRHVALPEPADVVLCDQIGRFGLEAGVVEYFDDARRRLLRPGGRLVPAAIDVVVAPVDCPDAFSRIEFWTTRPGGFDLSAAREIAANTGYPRRIEATELMADPVVAGRIDLSREEPRPIRLETSAAIAKPGTMHGLAAWFHARLSPGVVVTNSPLSADRINRRNVFFPINRPVQVAPGDEVRVAIQALPEELLVAWRVEVGPGGAAAEVRERFTHSTWRGMLVDRGELEHTRPGHVPRLTPRGRARLSVLELADGRRTIAEIEQEVLGRHADVFCTPAEAATFVAEVMTRYAE